MEDAIMTADGVFIEVSAVSASDTFNPLDLHMLFFNIGWLRRFKKNGISYLAIFSPDNGKFIGYYMEERFWAYNTIINKKKNTTTSSIEALGLKKDVDFYGFRANNESNVYFSYKSILRDNSVFKLVIKYGFRVAKELNETSTIEDVDLLPPITKSVISIVSAYGNYIIAKKYLTVNETLEELNELQLSELFDIIYVLDEVFNDSLFIDHLKELQLYEVLEAHINLPNRYKPASEGLDKPYHNLYNGKYFALFRLQLIEFRYWLLQFNQEYYKIDTNELIVYLVNIFPEIELSFLKIDVKINLLTKILKDNFWIIGNWEFNKLNEEKAVIKIINIFYREINGVPTYEEIDKFMDFLASRFESDSYNTVFHVLYRKINDGLNYGAGNRRLLINSIYNLWLESKFNPNHSNPQIAEAALTKFTYTPYTATNNPTLPPNSIDINAAPLILGYEAEKFLLWYRDNFTFPFFRDKVCAIDEDKKQVGYYHIFQPVTLKATNNFDNIIKFPFKGNSNDLESLNNSIPIFFLKYVDDAGDYSDANETIGLAIDVILTFTGIGNVTKLRQFRHLSKLRILAILAPEEKLLVLDAVSGVIGVIQITVGVASTVLDYVKDSCEDPVFCEKLNYWLFALEVATLSGDLLAKRALRRSAVEVIENVPTSGWPSSFTDPTDPLQNSRAILERIANISELIDNFRNTRIVNHPELRDLFDAFSASEKASFFYDFERQTDDVLKVLNDEVDLVSIWKTEINYLHTYKKNVQFLKAYKKIKSENDVLNHVHNGDARLIYDPPNTTGAEVTGYHNPDKLVDPPPAPGQISWVGQPIYSNPLNPDFGYSQGKIYRNMSDFTDPLTGNPWQIGGSSMKVKKRKNVFWPKIYDTQRINEEMAYAYSKIDKTKFVVSVDSKGKKIYTYKSMASDGHGIEIMFYDGNIDSGILNSIYPEYF